jgi:transposase
MVLRSYAPCGLTPILPQYLSRDHLAAIGAITLDGQLFLQTHEQAISSREVIGFLGWLQRSFRGQLLILWDGSPIHRSKPLKAYLANGAAERIHLEPFPGYAPELNPIEWVWSYMKVAQLANLACDSLPQLQQHVHNTKRRLQRKPNLIQSFIRHVGYRL